MSKVTSIDGYIENAQPFAKEILITLKYIVQNYCPESEEALKWGMPTFMYKGTILCSMASFKQHASFGFWLQSQMEDPHRIFKAVGEGGMGTLGKIRSIEDIPAENILGEYVLQAMQLIDSGVKIKKSANDKQRVLDIPKALSDALRKNAVIEAVFDKFSFSEKREYVDWLNGAKTEATFQRRLETTLSNLQEGKTKEWKYKQSAKTD